MARYDITKAPLLYQPVMVGKTRIALNPLTGQTTYAALIGGYVPGSGNTANGMVTSRDPSYPKAFVNNVGEMLQPRFGLVWDVFGTGKTAVRLGFGMFNAVVRNEPSTNQPPISYTTTIYYGNFNTLLNATGTLFPCSTPTATRPTARSARLPVPEPPESCSAHCGSDSKQSCEKDRTRICTDSRGLEQISENPCRSVSRMAFVGEKNQCGFKSFLLCSPSSVCPSPTQ
jgi:hypothetical protein